MYPQQKNVCQLDEKGYFIGLTEADLSPLEAEQGVYLLPANAVDIEPPEEKENQIAKYENQTWVYYPDYRGTVVYSTQDGRQQVISDIGEIPENYTALAPLDEPCKWNGKKWVVDDEKRTTLLQEQQAEMWEKIKQRRYENGLGGVFIERVGKWFQTGEEERVKYLGLDKVIDQLGEIDWKCADNSFIKMNRTLLNDIFLEVVKTENHDHINAEKHRLAMLAVDNPLDYDFSTGWSETYAA